MRRAAIVVRTANRPDILNRCLAAAVDGCDLARGAHWLLLDDSSPDNSEATREIARFWKQFGLRLAYVDKTVEAEIADSLPGATLRGFFTRLTARSPSCRTEGGRNFGLIAGLSLNPDVLFFVDDDMIHRHEGNCFFHWCANNSRSDSFIAAPRKQGISDMSYLNRLNNLLNRDDWARFFSDAGISSDPDLWYSPKNPFWKNGDGASDRAFLTLSEREVVSGQFIALRNRGADWLPFPEEYNSDLNWSLMQSYCLGTALLKVGGVNVKHLPPGLGCPQAESVLSEFIGTAIARALREIKPRGEQAMNMLAERLPEVLGVELKRELFLFLNVERAILCRAQTCDGVDTRRTLATVQDTLAEVGKRLDSIDSRQLASDWLNDFVARKKMLQELRRNEAVQTQVRRALFGTGV